MNLCTVFRIHYRTQFGDFISIRGENHGLSWAEGHEATWGLTESGEDVWELVLTSDGGSLSDAIRFKPLINDEVWAKGADYTVQPGEVIDIYPFFFANGGSVSKSLFTSEILGNTRKIALYLPPSYHENPFKRYPVILFQDGHNLFDPADSYCGDTWQLREAMDDGCCNGAIQEYIVVGVYPIKREFEYLPTKWKGNGGGGAERYLDALTHELRPRIDSELRTKDSYAIAGSSYGGIISLYAWVTRPEYFDVCGAFSPSMKYDNKKIIETIKRNLHRRPAAHHKLYMDCGTIKDEQSAIIEMADYMIRDSTLGDDQFQFVIAEGHAHTERHWAIRTPRALTYMFADPQRVQESLIPDSGSESGESSYETDDDM